MKKTIMHFCCYGHKSILGTHPTTFEFTKDVYLTEKGNCIIGIKADFDAKELLELVKKNNKVKIVLEANFFKDEIIAIVNKRFNDSKEIVVRLGQYISERTFAIDANKAAKHVNRDIINAMKNPEQKMHVTILPL